MIKLVVVVVVVVEFSYVFLQQHFRGVARIFLKRGARGESHCVKVKLLIRLSCRFRYLL